MGLQLLLVSDRIPAQLLGVGLLSSWLVIGWRHTDLDFRFHRHQPLRLHSSGRRSRSSSPDGNQSSGCIWYIKKTPRVVFLKRLMMFNYMNCTFGAPHPWLINRRDVNSTVKSSQPLCCGIALDTGWWAVIDGNLLHWIYAAVASVWCLCDFSAALSTSLVERSSAEADAIIAHFCSLTLSHIHTHALKRPRSKSTSNYITAIYRNR